MADIFNKEQAKRLLPLLLPVPVWRHLRATVIWFYGQCHRHLCHDDAYCRCDADDSCPHYSLSRQLKQTELGNAEVAIDIEKAKIGGYPLRVS